jgi:hypothetical protein
MKKAVILFAAGLFLLASLPAFSQAQSAYPKDAYFKTVPLMKVWLHDLGYKLQFFNSKASVSDIYVPLTWFNKGAQSKAELVYGNEKGVPYCTILWVDGAFDHITLYVSNDLASSSWGVLSVPGDLSALFNVQEVPKEF